MCKYLTDKEQNSICTNKTIREKGHAQSQKIIFSAERPPQRGRRYYCQTLYPAAMKPAEKKSKIITNYLYNHLANYYSDEELDTKYQELYKNRKDFTTKEKNKIFSEKMKHYNPISYH